VGGRHRALPSLKNLEPQTGLVIAFTQLRTRPLITSRKTLLGNSGMAAISSQRTRARTARRVYSQHSATSVSEESFASKKNLTHAMAHTISQQYRQLADVCRKRAETFSDPSARTRLLEIAAEYERKSKQSETKINAAEETTTSTPAVADWFSKYFR